jgi:glycogen synthase
MKLLFVSNLYPPHHISGYEMLCHEAATQLKARGHQVSVLTSTYGVTGRQAEPDIYRRLSLESDRYYYRIRHLMRYWGVKRSNDLAVQQAVAKLSPEVVVLWGMWNLSRLVAASAERFAGPRVVYYLADVWPGEPSAHEAYWDGTANSLAGRMFKRVFRGPVRLALGAEWRPYRLHYEHVVASCQSTRDELIEAGLPIEHCQVIYEGIDPVPYRTAAERREPGPDDGPLRVVFVGTLAAHKGAHTAVEAFGHLKESGVSAPMHLTILGAGHPDYEAHLHQLVDQWHLEDQVSFRRPIPRSELPEFLARFDVLVMPSVYKEPLARISQEAMAAGLVLVATPTGGTKEILVHGQNGLAFEPENAQALADRLRALADDAGLRQRLAQKGWETVSERFTISRMVSDLETYLSQVAAKACT